MTNFKTIAFGALATIGLATAAISQPSVDRGPMTERAQGQQNDAMRGGMQGDMSGMMSLMNDPEMCAEMMEMMRNCNEMMENMQERMSHGEEG